MTTFDVNDRVEAHPCTDVWMMGDRYGTVVNFVNPKNTDKVGIIVLMDKTGKRRMFFEDTLLMIRKAVSA